MDKRHFNKFLEEWFNGGGVTEEAGQRKPRSRMHMAGSAAKQGADLATETQRSLGLGYVGCSGGWEGDMWLKIGD